MRSIDPVDKKPRVLLEIRTSRTGEETPESMVQFLSTLTSLKKRLMFFWRFGLPLSLEIAVIEQRIHFYLNIPLESQNFIESQLVSQYAKSLIVKSEDYMPKLLMGNKEIAVGQLKLGYAHLYPIRTFKDFKEVDPLSSLLGILSKTKPGDEVALQFLLLPISSRWQRSGAASANKKYTDKAGVAQANPYAAVITEKIASNGFKAAIRIAVASNDSERSERSLEEIANSFSSFNNPSGNFLVYRRPYLWQRQRLISAMLRRSKYFMPTGQILNVQEVASMYHFPTAPLANIPNISWFKTILSDPPEMLPVAENLSEEQEKSDVNFFARTEFKNKPTVFGIKKKDRLRHIYIIGKTGTGKSTLIANMAINDMRNNRGFCIVDPHGDLCETILDYVPSHRINDVVYLDPSNQEHTFSLNLLEVKNPLQSELIVSGVVAIFRKLYDFSWGPRLEYILRNTLLSIINLPGATFLMIPEILTNTAFRKRVVEQLSDPVLRNFWLNEFNTMPDRMKAEALSPILNKVGQFLSARAIRNIVKNPKSTIDLESIMNDGKILLLNLSQGKLGEDNAALLGAMTITQIQLAAMSRAHIPEEERKDFYLYVDEFQNFATSSFTKILSEARKFRLALVLANQYIAQVPEDVRSAIFGNAGTMLSFLIGAEDTPIVAKEFSERFKEEDLLALGNHRAIIKLAIDGVTQSPFLCTTLPLPENKTLNKEKAIKVSQEQYTKPVTVETEMPNFNASVPLSNKPIGSSPLTPTMYEEQKSPQPQGTKPPFRPEQKNRPPAPRQFQRPPQNRQSQQSSQPFRQNRPGQFNRPNISQVTPLSSLKSPREQNRSPDLPPTPMLNNTNLQNPVASTPANTINKEIILEPFDSKNHASKINASGQSHYSTRPLNFTKSNTQKLSTPHVNPTGTNSVSLENKP